MDDCASQNQAFCDGKNRLTEGLVVVVRVKNNVEIGRVKDMEILIGLLIGFVVGGALGIFITCFLLVRRDDDDRIMCDYCEYKRKYDEEHTDSDSNN